MKRFTFLVLAFGTLSVSAASPTLITATITITNPAGTTNGQTITVNADTRTWTNSVIVPTAQILTNNTIFGCASNLYNAVATSPFLNLSLLPLTNGIVLQTITVGGPMSVTLSAGWGLVVLSTNIATPAWEVRVPFSVQTPVVQTNTATYVAQGLESSTYGLSFWAPFLSNITAFVAPGVGVSSVRVGSNVTASGIGSLSVGNNATSTGTRSTAVGFNATATNFASAAFGGNALASGSQSMALGPGAIASNDNSTAVGVLSIARATNASAFGQGATATNNNSTAIGQSATTTLDNQIVLGTASQKTWIPGGLTNGVNYGNAFSSPGTNATTEQFGAGAATAGTQSLAVGNTAGAMAVGSSALGYNAAALGIYGLALGPSTIDFANYGIVIGWGAQSQASNGISIGVNSSALGVQGVNIGYNSQALGLNSSALGYNSWGRYDYSTAIGYNATATRTNQVQLGSSADEVAIPGNVEIGGSVSNITFAGTNFFPKGADIAFGRYALTTIANGNNAAVAVGTNVFEEISGPSGAFTINGIAGGRDGKFLILLNRTGQSMTIANDSGVDPAPANRIYTARATDSTIAGNCAAFLIYNANVTHWVLLFLTQ